jgi:N-methylhydantoinase A
MILGVDVGGTFTDLLLADPAAGGFRIAKVPSTPADQSDGFMAGLDALGVTPGALETIIHGTTVGTNAVLERKGVRCGMITTRGFRDTLELGRRTRPNAWGMFGHFEPIISRDRRLEVTERIDASGNVVAPLDEDEVRAAVQALREMGAEALIIHFVHAYLNPDHEARAGAIAREVWPESFITLGSEILREVREFERGSTAALNGYIQPIMTRYLGHLQSRLGAGGFAHELLVMQGNGGMMTAGIAGEKAVQTVMSGPAAGAIAAAHLGAAAGFPNVISCDMGGTSFDIAIVRGGAPATTTEKDISYGMPLRVPMVDIQTIGAGGGSIAWIDDGGLLRVGPESAGATPGPICYGRGGTEPTVTDANLLLGRIDPRAIAGLDVTLDLDAVRAVMREKIGDPLGLDAVEAAAAVIRVVDHQMAGAARLVSVDKGHDPREFALFAFGGAGPMHATAIARELGVPNVLVPRFPGITSALGCVLADVRHDFVQTLHQPLEDVDPTEADRILARQASEGRGLLEREGVVVATVEIVHEADLFYRGQSHVFRVAVESPGFATDTVREAFAALYRERFDILLPEMQPILVSLRTTVRGVRAPIDLGLVRDEGEATLAAAEIEVRPVYFDGAWHDTPIYQRERLPADAAIAGPAVIQQLDTTILVEPGSDASVDAVANLVVSVPKPAARAEDAGAETLDPVTLAVIESGLEQVSSEMDLVHQRTSFSPVISEAYDRSNGIYARETGEIIAQGELGLPIFLGVMQSTTQAVIAERDDLEPGDIILVNDPYFGGTHLMDVKMVRPFFYKGELWAYLSNTGHWPDTGGMVPGGFSSEATEIQQEGLRLPPVKFHRRGKLDNDIQQIVLANIRVPDERIGDIRAQVGALSVGERRLTALLDKYGEATVSAAIEILKDRSERRMRAYIEAIPDGRYSFSSYMDSDGVDSISMVRARPAVVRSIRSGRRRSPRSIAASSTSSPMSRSMRVASAPSLSRRRKTPSFTPNIPDQCQAALPRPHSESWRPSSVRWARPSPIAFLRRRPAQVGTLASAAKIRSKGGATSCTSSRAVAMAAGGTMTGSRTAAPRSASPRPNPPRSSNSTIRYSSRNMRFAKARVARGGTAAVSA